MAQEQTRLSVAPLDSNITCAKATVIPHTFNKNEFLVDSFANKGGNSAHYIFTATSKSGKIKTVTDDYIFYSLDSLNSCGAGKIVSSKGQSITSEFQGLTIGNKYILKIGNYLTKKFKVTVIANKKDDNASNLPTNLNSFNPYYFNTSDYSKGRESNYSYLYCSTSKADSNVVTIFVKFKATSTSETLNLNIDNSLLESRLGLTSAPNTCQAIQKNKNLRTDIFTGLTIGNDYTVRIEIGGDAALGYARTSTANNASITLVGGSVTGVENNNQPTFSIAPNPSNGNFTFVSNENADIIISDLLGSKVADLQNVIPNQNIDLQLPKGIYLLNVSNAKGSKIEKLVIE